MDAILLTQSFSGWDQQCYRITNSTLVQFKKEVTSFADIVSGDKSQIEREYELTHLDCAVTLEADSEPVFQIDINHIQLFLKFFGDQRMQQFAAWLRILASCKPSTLNPKCTERPMASNICFSLYHTLQRLYHHHRHCKPQFVLPTKAYREQHLSSIQHIYYELAVHYNINVLFAADFNLLFNALLYMLANLPTSLFTFKYQQKLAALIGDILSDSTSCPDAAAKSKEEQDQVEQDQVEQEHRDKHIARLDDRDALGSIKNAFIRYYTKDKKLYKQKNGFALFHRYGFLSLLFTFLNFVYNTHQHNIELDVFATLMANALRSAQADTQSVDMDSFYAAEQNFRILVKVCIYYVHEIFASPRKVPWKVYTLLTDSGNERASVDQYNELVKERSQHRQYILDAQKLEKSLEIKNRKWHFKTYRNCFVGRDAIETIINLKFATNAPQAIEFGDKLRQCHIIQHVEQQHTFKNEKLFYRFLPGYDQRIDLERTPHSIAHLKIHRNEQFDASLDDRRKRTLEVEDSKLQDMAIEFSAMSDSRLSMSGMGGPHVSSGSEVFGAHLAKRSLTDGSLNEGKEHEYDSNDDNHGHRYHPPPDIAVKTATTSSWDNLNAATHHDRQIMRPITPHYDQASTNREDNNVMRLYDDKHEHEQIVELIEEPTAEEEEEKQ